MRMIELLVKTTARASLRDLYEHDGVGACDQPLDPLPPVLEGVERVTPDKGRSVTVACLPANLITLPHFSVS
jgi:hypothetical protein